MLFEHAWTEGFKAYARVYDPQSGSVKKEISSGVEYFEPNERGLYKCVIDTGLNYSKRHGSWKDAKDQAGVTQPVYRYIRENHWGLENSSYNTNPRIMYLDIETRALGVFPDPALAEQEVVLIQCHDSLSQKTIILGTREFDPAPDVMYVKCDNEVDLFNKFFAIFKRLNPLIIYAWNGSGFDYPYLYNRISNLGLNPDNMSNYGSVRLTEKMSMDARKCYNLMSAGHYWIDMLDIYKKSVLKPRASYALDAIAEVELGDHKVPHTEFMDFDSFYTGARYNPASEPYDDELRENIRQAYLSGDKAKFEHLVFRMFVLYGAQDVKLLSRLDNKIKLTQLMTMQSSMMGVLFDDILSTTKPWGIYLSHIAMLDNLVLPRKVEHQDSTFKGGFVREPTPGKYKWVMNCDVNSMYPMLAMVGFNISPETYIPIHRLPVDLREIVLKYFNNEDEDSRLKLPQEVWDKVKEILLRENYSMAMNGAVFDCSKEGLMPQLIKRIYTNRKAAKKEMQDVERFIVGLESLKEFGTKDTTVDHKMYKENPECIRGLSKCTVDNLLKVNSNLQDQLNTKQLTLKIMINALYGAQGNKHFIFFNKEAAAAVTSSGRFFIKKLANYIEDKLQSLVKSDRPYVIYGDTDSILNADTIVYTEDGTKTVTPEDLFNDANGTVFEQSPNNLIKLLSDSVYTETADGPSKITYIKKHKTPKRLFRLTAGDKTITVTEDHSLMVMRNGALIKASVKTLLPDDQLVIRD